VSGVDARLGVKSKIKIALWAAAFERLQDRLTLFDLGGTVT
jgi:hypothetical protein